MNTETHRQLANDIWSICNLLRGPYKRNEYRKVILPLTVLRRFDCLLAPTKTQALETFNQYKGKPESIIRSVMQSATGYPFYNLSKLELAPSQKGRNSLLDDPSNLAPNLNSYINGYSPNIRAIFDHFKFGDQHRLCLGLLGLEKLSQRGCFGLQVKTCLGACVGKEDRQEHDQRLFSALVDLKVHAWPFPGAVDLVEQCGDWVQKHRVQDWRYMGTWCSRANQLSSHEQHGFDLDTYKILAKPVMLNSARIEVV